MSRKTQKRSARPCTGTGELVRIGNKDYCVGEKIVSKWKHSKLNQKKKKKKQARKTRKA